MMNAQKVVPEHESFNAAFRSEVEYNALVDTCDMVAKRDDRGVLCASLSYVSTYGRIAHELYEYRPVYGDRHVEIVGGWSDEHLRTPLTRPLYYCWVRAGIFYSNRRYGGLFHAHWNE